jgi:hypothetical protein
MMQNERDHSKDLVRKRVSEPRKGVAHQGRRRSKIF